MSIDMGDKRIPPPETYDITLVISASGVGIELKVAMQEVKRSDIFGPGYPEIIATAVRLYERFAVAGEPVDE